MKIHISKSADAQLGTMRINQHVFERLEEIAKEKGVSIVKVKDIPPLLAEARKKALLEVRETVEKEKMVSDSETLELMTEGWNEAVKQILVKLDEMMKP